ncbi:MAG: tetratricopeptide repeat protein [candidate division KSB1 bacterium]|nr:tetratricopeptide repeat protein [candidate division KSB1 bacterium]MDZ7275354.1 tetratricopeptide repeat protein [candidate division KSB1 bacterium]MDZ7287521.1 tetratricopeptide repeat protein [candidate division KSB1 bacterium]MDZ7299635.1 tetratricopeptide repeat protein [candidate division KSB1 bacterium]MDZ7307428.1 tetratricopeptide repeat protein [candidate division KSB1 bacterium]
MSSRRCGIRKPSLPFVAAIMLFQLWLMLVPHAAPCQPAGHAALEKSWSRGWDHYQHRRYAEALPHFWQVARHDSMRRFDKVFNYLGQAYFKLGQIDSARQVYALGVARFPADDNLRRNLAFLHSSQGDYAAAITQYRELQHRGQATVEDLRKLAGLYRRSGQPQEAIALLETLVTANPADDEARRQLEELYQAGGETEKWLASLEHTLDRQPGDTLTLLRLAVARLDRREYQAARVLLERYLAHAPRTAKAMSLMGEAQRNLGQFEQALASFTQARALAGDDPALLVQMAACRNGLRQFAAARALVQQALQHRPGYGSALLMLGEIYETCARTCVRASGRLTFDDKLVFQLAYEAYARAQQDAATRTEAKQRMAALAALLPGNDDYFMNKNHSQASGPCYAWLHH